MVISKIQVSDPGPSWPSCCRNTLLFDPQENCQSGFNETFRTLEEDPSRFTGNHNIREKSFYQVIDEYKVLKNHASICTLCS